MNFPEINKSSGIKPEFEQWSVRVRKSSLGYLKANSKREGSPKI